MRLALDLLIGHCLISQTGGHICPISTLPCTVCIRTKYIPQFAPACAGATRFVVQALASDDLQIDKWLFHHLLSDATPHRCKVATFSFLRAILKPEHANTDTAAHSAQDASPTSASDDASAAVDATVPTAAAQPAAVTSGLGLSASEHDADSNSAVKSDEVAPTAADVSQDTPNPSDADVKAIQQKLLQKMFAAVPAAVCAAFSSADKLQPELPASESSLASPTSRGAGNPVSQHAQHESASQPTPAQTASAVDAEAFHMLVGLLMQTGTSLGFSGLRAAFAFPSSLLSSLPQLLEAPQVYVISVKIMYITPCLLCYTSSLPAFSQPAYTQRA